MRSFKSIFAVSLLLLAGQIQAAQFFFTTTPTLTAAGAPAAANTNPTLNLGLDGPGGIGTGHLYLWVKLAPDDASFTPTERINAMGVDVVQQGTPRAHGTNYVVYNTVGVPVGQRRWDSPAPTSNNPVAAGGESVGSPTLAVFRRGAVSRLGLQSPNGGDTEPATVVDASGNNYLRVADISIQIDTIGTVPIFLRTNTFTIAYDTTLPNKGPNVFFGAGDAAVNPTNINGGVQSAQPDATLTYVLTDPEPPGIQSLAFGALAFFRRRFASAAA